MKKNKIFLIDFALHNKMIKTMFKLLILTISIHTLICCNCDRNNKSMKPIKTLTVACALINTVFANEIPNSSGITKKEFYNSRCEQLENFENDIFKIQKKYLDPKNSTFQNRENFDDRINSILFDLKVEQKINNCGSKSSHEKLQEEESQKNHQEDENILKSRINELCMQREDLYTQTGIRHFRNKILKIKEEGKQLLKKHKKFFRLNTEYRKKIYGVIGLNDACGKKYIEKDKSKKTKSSSKSKKTKPSNKPKETGPEDMFEIFKKGDPLFKL